MSWTSPTITHTRGRFVRHTHVTMVGTLASAVAQVSDDILLPKGIFAGSYMAVSDNGTSTKLTTLSLLQRSAASTVTFISATEVLTLASDPDYFLIRSIFDNWTQPDNYANKNVLAMGSIGAALGEHSVWNLSVVSNEDPNTDETVTVYMGFLSHILEV